MPKLFIKRNAFSSIMQYEYIGIDIGKNFITVAYEYFRVLNEDYNHFLRAKLCVIIESSLKLES